MSLPDEELSPPRTIFFRNQEGFIIYTETRQLSRGELRQGYIVIVDMPRISIHYRNEADPYESTRVGTQTWRIVDWRGQGKDWLDAVEVP